MADRIPQVVPVFDDDEIDGVRDAIERTWLSEGPCAAEFLESLRHLTGSEYAVLAPNGTLGLFLSLLALDLPRGSEIVVPSFTFCASASAAVFAGLVPVFADVDPETWTIGVDELQKVVTPRTRAVMPVHVYGHSAPVDAIVDYASSRGLVVIEDAAQGCGVRLRDRHTGTWGDIGMISFFSDKTITTGEGAVVLTQRDDLARRLRLLRNQGREDSGTFVHPELGMNFRVTDLQCAVGVAQIRKLPEIIRSRQVNDRRFRRNLAGLDGVRPMRVQAGSDLVPFRFPVLVPDRAALESALGRAGVASRPFFHPLHLQPCLRQYTRGPLPVSEWLADHGICLPIHGGLGESGVDEISGIVRDVVGSGSF